MMKTFALISMAVSLMSLMQAQDSEKKTWLKLFTPHWDNFEYVSGNVKEIHYQSYHITYDEDEVVKGDPFTYSEAQNVEIRQPWSPYFDKKGNVIKAELFNADTLNIYVNEFSRNPDGTILEERGLDEKRKIKHRFTGYKKNSSRLDDDRKKN